MSFNLSRKFFLQYVETLPEFVPSKHEGQIVFVTSTKELWAGTGTGWVNNTVSDEYLKTLIMDCLEQGTGIHVWKDTTNKKVTFSINASYLADLIQTTVGDMVTNNSETGINVTYDSVNKKLNFVVTAAATLPNMSNYETRANVVAVLNSVISKLNQYHPGSGIGLLS